MNSSWVQKIRKALGLQQSEFAQLFGVHPMTVSKWERGTASPSPYQTALLSDFEKASKKQKFDDEIKMLLITAGVVAAIFFLLSLVRNK